MVNGPGRANLAPQNTAQRPDDDPGIGSSQRQERPTLEPKPMGPLSKLANWARSVVDEPGAERTRVDLALLAAVKSKNIPSAVNALKQGADPNKRERTAFGGGYGSLHIAIKNDDQAMVELLLGNPHSREDMDPYQQAPRADPNLPTLDTLKTPLMYAVKRQNPGIVNTLVAHGADNRPNEKDKETPLHVALRAARESRNSTATEIYQTVLASEQSRQTPAPPSYSVAQNPSPLPHPVAHEPAPPSYSVAHDPNQPTEEEVDLAGMPNGPRRSS